MSTIAAISTAPGIGGIGIIRISGKNSFDIVSKIFRPIHEENNASVGYSIKYGHIVEPETKEIVDEVLVSYFQAPKSYTTEDMCEINCHGSIIVLQEILKICLENGAQIAEPGEFTKRAFLNGRIDLSQAEAVIDIIQAKSERESQSSIKQLEGYLSKEVRKIKKRILEIITTIEATIDYPEYDIEKMTNDTMIEKLQEIKEKLKILEKSFENGKVIREGIKIAIIGKPNVGKSSLLNSILKEERAIVTEYEGTTRDTIEEYITIEGITFKIIDTAGIREAKDEVEKIGINKAKRLTNEADLILAILDITREIDKEDKAILDLIKNKKAIIILNKIDLEQNNMHMQKEIEEISKKENKRVIKLSAKENEGINHLFGTISEMFALKNIGIENEVIVTNIRHKTSIAQAKEACERAIDTMKEGIPLDLVAIYIKEILERLGEITGENASEEIIKEIFSKFCLGK